MKRPTCGDPQCRLCMRGIEPMWLDKWGYEDMIKPVFDPLQFQNEFIAQWDIALEDPTSKGGEEKMQNFKVGDEVKHVRECSGGTPVGKIGKVTYMNSEGTSGWIKSEDYDCGHLSTWELISSANKPMATLTKQQEKFLDEDSKALVKVGVLNSRLEVDSEAITLTMLVELNRKQLAEAAREQLKAEEAKEEEGEE